MTDSMAAIVETLDRHAQKLFVRRQRRLEHMDRARATAAAYMTAAAKTIEGGDECAALNLMEHAASCLVILRRLKGENVS